MVTAQAALWPLLYAPPLAAIGFAAWLMARHKVRAQGTSPPSANAGAMAGEQ